MGNCLGAPQNPPPRHGRWHPNPINHPPGPVHHGQPPVRGPLHPNVLPKGNLDNLDGELEDLYETQGGTVKKRSYQSKEVNINQTFLMQKYQGQCHQNFNSTVYIKTPMNREETIFQSIAQPLWIFPPMIGMLKPQQMQNGYFQEKMTWLRFQA
jgi:hypothetical protein